MSAEGIARALGPAALLLLIAAGVGLFVRADLQREVRQASRVKAAQIGELPESPRPKRPGGLDHRRLAP